MYSQAKNELRQLSDSNSSKHLVSRQRKKFRKVSRKKNQNKVKKRSNKNDKRSRQSNNKREKQTKRNRNKTNKRKKSGYGKRTKSGGSRKMTGAEINTRFEEVIVLFLGCKSKHSVYFTGGEVSHFTNTRFCSTFIA